MTTLLERGTYTRLLAAILLMLLVLPLVGHHVGHPRWLSVTFFLMVLVAALEATQAERRTRMLVWVSGGVAILTSALAIPLRDVESTAKASALELLLDVLNHGSSIFFLGIVVMLLIQRALASGRITGERIVAAICAYLLLGLLWAEAYQVLSVWYGGVITTPMDEALGIAPDPTYQDYVYFSYVTLTTLGYGDMLPSHPASRALAYLEAVTGVLYLATLVARLVALHIAHEGLESVDEKIDEALEEALEQRDQDDAADTPSS